MSTADRAADLRAQADALDNLSRLEADLLAAKQAHADNPTEETKTAKHEAALRLREARAASRSEGVSVGGDAVVADEPAESVTVVNTGQEG